MCVTYLADEAVTRPPQVRSGTGRCRCDSLPPLAAVAWRARRKSVSSLRHRQQSTVSNQQFINDRFVMALRKWFLFSVLNVMLFSGTKLSSYDGR